jgi:hypothetical protein
MPIILLLIGVVFLLIIGLGVLLGSLDIQNIKADWANRRCDPTVMFSAFLYKPSSDPRSASAFATDNFNFCLRNLVKEVFNILLAPALGVFSQQMSAANTTGQVFNSIRNQLGNQFRSFSSIFDSFFDTYKRTTLQISRITQLIRAAMLKVSAVIVSIVFMGLSLMTSLLNTYDFIIKVVIIILGIIVAMIILLFFALIPFMPVIFTTIAILTAAGMGGAVGGMAGAFCLHPNTKIALHDGAKISIKSINIGDKLAGDSGRVTGILETDTIGELYNIRGVIMSASHLVEHKGQYIFADRHPDAVLYTNILPGRLIILNTEGRSIPTLDKNGDILHVKDWEEIPDDDEEGQLLWEKEVDKILNSATTPKSSLRIPESIGLFSKMTCVIAEDLGQIPISYVKRGDSILDINNNFTRVLGIYRGALHINTYPVRKFWYSDGVRILDIDNKWITGDALEIDICPHSEITEHTQRIYGYNLITESGTFCIISNDEYMLTVRDFTEVGYMNIDKTYAAVQKHLSLPKKKKEIQQNSNTVECVSDSSSQVYYCCLPQIFY